VKKTLHATLSDDSHKDQRILALTTTPHVDSDES
jgi:hypothetical protein